MELPKPKSHISLSKSDTLSIIKEAQSKSNFDNSTSNIQVRKSSHGESKISMKSVNYRDITLVSKNYTIKDAQRISPSTIKSYSELTPDQDIMLRWNDGSIYEGSIQNMT